MSSKIVIENAVLRGSQDNRFLQRVATVYSDGQEYRILAPAMATGRADEWAEQLIARQPSSGAQGSDSAVDHEAAALMVNAVVAELRRKALELDIWNWGAHPDARFYAAHICLSGDVISSDGTNEPRGDEHCEICGKRLIHGCTTCEAPIRGKPVMSSKTYIAPSFCYNCGDAYPWMEDRLRTAKELLKYDDKLTFEEREDLWDLLQYVMSNPKSDLIPAKCKLIEIILHKAAVGTRDILTDVVAKYLAEMSKP